MTNYTHLTLIFMTFGTVITLFCVGISQYKSIVLKKEQIKADAMVKAEEIKAKNNLELERLIKEDQHRTSKLPNRIDESMDTRFVREKQNA
jgi:hypothetical protein